MLSLFAPWPAAEIKRTSLILVLALWSTMELLITTVICVTICSINRQVMGISIKLTAAFAPAGARS